MKATTTVVCLGDSITKGMISYNWVRELSRKTPEFRFLNHGINGDLAYNVLKRLEPVIAAKPDVLVILPNDALCESKHRASYQKNRPSAKAS